MDVCRCFDYDSKRLFSARVMGYTITIGAIAFALGGVALRWRWPAVPKALASSLFVGAVTIAAGESFFVDDLQSLTARAILFSIALNAATLVALVEISFTGKRSSKPEGMARAKGLTTRERKSLQRAFSKQTGNVSILYEFESTIDVIEEIADIFHSQGWSTTIASGGGIWGMPAPSKPIRLIYKTGNSLAPTVKDGFAEAEIEFEILETDIGTDDIEIEVSRFFAERR